MRRGIFKANEDRAAGRPRLAHTTLHCSSRSSEPRLHGARAPREAKTKISFDLINSGGRAIGRLRQAFCMRLYGSSVPAPGTRAGGGSAS
jgi:hypothetical protein